MQYFGRGLIQLLEGVRRQVPVSLDVRLDVDAILGAISYQPADRDTREALPPWPLAPGRKTNGVPPADAPRVERGVDGDDEGANSTRVDRKHIVADWMRAHSGVRPFFPELLDKWSDMRVMPWNDKDDGKGPPCLVDFEFDEEFEDDRVKEGMAAERRPGE